MKNFLRGHVTLLLIALATMLVAPAAAIAADGSAALLDSQRLWVSSQALDGEHDYSGALTGSIDCQEETPSSLSFTSSGNAYGDLNGTFTQTVSADIDGRTLTRFDVTFDVTLNGPDGLITVTGTAHLLGTPAGRCRIIPVDPDQLYFVTAGTPGDSGLLLEYTAIVDSDGVQDEVSGFVGASVLFQCWSAVVDQALCPDAESTLTFGMDAPPPPEPPYVPPAPWLIASNALGGDFGSLEGTTSGSFSCGTQSMLDMAVAGNAYGPYPGTFTESVHIELAGDAVQVFTGEFTILSGDTTVSGTAQYLGGTSSGECGSHVDEDDGLVYQFSSGALLQYEATIDSPAGISPVTGWASASVSLYCLASSTFSENCNSATSMLKWLVPEIVGDNGEASTGDSVDEENPAAVAVSNPAGGTIEITPWYSSSPATSSYMVVGQGYIIEASNPATANDPIKLTFMLHSSQLYDYENDVPIDPASVTVLRNGQALPVCSGGGLVAAPDPCLYSREVDGEGNLTLVALTSHASLWQPAALTTQEPRAAKQDALATLQGMAVDGKTSKTIGKAIEALRVGLADSLWVDDSHLNRKTGGKVFEQDKAAVKELTKKELAAYSQISDVIDLLLDADRALAQTAIDEAVAAGAKPKDVQAARDELAKGDALSTSGKFEQAIDSYKAAWDKAQKSHK